MPRLLSSEKISPRDNNIDDDDNIDAIKRWLMSKFFRFNAKTRQYETQELNAFCVNSLKSSKFCMKFCIKLCTSHMSSIEYQKKMHRRSLYGANSMIFVLMPLDKSEDKDDSLFQAYMSKNRKSFYQILSLFNENHKLSDENLARTLNNYEFMFISYLEDNNQTKACIEHILGSGDR